MKILKVLNGCDAGGIFTCETQYISCWAERGVKTDALIIGDGKAAGNYRKLVHTYHQLPDLRVRHGGRIGNILGSIRKSRNYAREIVEALDIEDRYGAIIYRRPFYIHIGGALARKVNAPVFWHMPNAVNRRLGKWYYNYYMNKYDIEPVANSIYTQKTLGSSCRHVIYPGYDRDRVTKVNDTYRKELGIPDDAAVFGTASRLHRTKAQDLLIRGLVESGVLNANAHCIIAGGPIDSDYARKLKRMAQPYEDKIHFLGRIDDLPKFYSSIDLYVNCRRNEEPFGISVAEAMGAGLPIVAYYKGGPSEMINHGENGWLIREASAAGYAEILKEAYESRPEWAKMGLRSGDRAPQYQVTHNASDFLSIIEQYSDAG